MENLLREYMDRAFAERGIENPGQPNPVVTISREYGCPSKLIAMHLTRELNKLYNLEKPARWKFINKEVVEATAKRLEMNPNEVNYNLNAGEKGFVGDVLASFSQNYVSSLRLRKTITSVVRSIAEQGFVIIVGRGGVGILQNAPFTIHVRLQASREWRIGEISKTKNLGIRESSKMVDEMDKKRIAIIELMTGGKFHPNLFDISFNCQTLQNEEVVNTIVELMKIRKMI